MLFQRTIRQTVNVHELNEQVGYHQDNLTSMQGEISDMGEQVNTAISDMGEQVNTAMSTSQSSMQSQMAASTSSQVATLTRELSSIRSSMVEQQALMTTTLAAADVAVQTTVRSLNVSVQQALVAASNAASPQIYIQWGARRCTAPGGVTVLKLCKKRLPLVHLPRCRTRTGARLPVRAAMNAMVHFEQLS